VTNIVDFTQRALHTVQTRFVKTNFVVFTYYSSHSLFATV